MNVYKIKVVEAAADSGHRKGKVSYRAEIINQLTGKVVYRTKWYYREFRAHCAASIALSLFRDYASSINSSLDSLSPEVQADLLRRYNESFAV